MKTYLSQNRHVAATIDHRSRVYEYPVTLVVNSASRRLQNGRPEILADNGDQSLSVTAQSYKSSVHCRSSTPATVPTTRYTCIGHWRWNRNWDTPNTHTYPGLHVSLDIEAGKGRMVTRRTHPSSDPVALDWLGTILTRHHACRPTGRYPKPSPRR
jgi:hypothetical protein